MDYHEYLCHMKGLVSSSAHVRCNALKYFCSLVQSETYDTNVHLFSTAELAKVSIRLLQDQDPRVRQVALHGLSYLLDSKRADLSHCYHDFVPLLQDDYHFVRLEAIETLTKLAFCFPKVLVSIHDTLSMTLIDKVFIDACDMVNDVDLCIRIKACQLMIKFEQVSTGLLLQALNKKQIPYEPGSEASVSLLQSADREALSDEPEGEEMLEIEEMAVDGSVPMGTMDKAATKKMRKRRRLDASQTEPSWTGQAAPDVAKHLVHRGACGSFIIAMEDEFPEMRIAAIEAMYHFCLTSQVFSYQALDFLIDAFNDEVDSVRLKAILAVYQLSSYRDIYLNELNVLHITIVLDDTLPTIRHAANLLLRNVHLQGVSTIRIVLQALLNNLKRYANDLSCILNCCQAIGRRHANDFVALVDELLKIDRRFLIPEPFIDDLFYTCMAVAIVNASFYEQRVIPLLPSYLFKHYLYHVYKYPYCFDSIDDKPELLALFHPSRHSYLTFTSGLKDEFKN